MVRQLCFREDARKCTCVHHQKSFTKTQLMNLPTRAEIPDAEMNDWGYPHNAKWMYRGVIGGFARYSIILHRRECEIGVIEIDD